MEISRASTVSEVIIIEPDIFKDDRGHFLECYRAQNYLDHGIPDRFVQDNLSYSRRGVLRGLHYQLRQPQGKLVYVAYGEVYDVAVDIRADSSTFGKWVGVTLSSKTATQIYIPEGFAHGFCVTSSFAVVVYKCTEYYSPMDERGIGWNDPSLNISWPVDKPILSDKDRANPTLRMIEPTELPEFKINK